MLFRSRGKSCEVFPAPFAVRLFEQDGDSPEDVGTMVEPDISVICDKSKVDEHGCKGAPDLVVEVLSPSTMRNDKTKKKDAYARCGVREYWLVSPEEKSVEIYRTNGSELILHDIYALHPDWQLAQMTHEERAAVVTHFQCSLFPDLEIPLADLFYRTF